MNRVTRLLTRSAVSIVPSLARLEVFRHSLMRSGWIESHRRHEPVDQQGRPLPWITYAAIHFLEARVQPTMHVFEYGAGNSTRWWAERVARVLSCEHDADWAATLNDLPDNASIIREPLGSSYVESINGRGPFDVIVIDGRKRIRCASECLAELAPDGVILFDNTERAGYRKAYELLATNGFRQLEFHGLGPINPKFWSTSIFYRSDNCLGI